jgi:hypothetical protein
MNLAVFPKSVSVCSVTCSDWLLCSSLLVFLASASREQNSQLSPVCAAAMWCFLLHSQCFAHPPPRPWIMTPPLHWAINHSWNSSKNIECNTRHFSLPASNWSCILFGGAIMGNVLRCCWGSESCCEMLKGPCQEMDLRNKCHFMTRLYWEFKVWGGEL